MSVQPQVIPLIVNGSVNNGTSFLLTASGVFVDTQTITIGGVVFTTVTPIGTTAGNVLLGANQAATLANLETLINAPGTTTATGVALSAANIATLLSLGITASATATVLTITSSNGSVFTVSETQTNAAWTIANISRGFGPVDNGRASIQFSASGITSGNAVFTVQVSNDGVNWTDYNRLTTNVTNTNAQTDLRAASVTLSTNTSSVVIIQDPFAFYRVSAIITTDGIYQATAYVV